jgi:hypothetical protein
VKAEALETGLATKEEENKISKGTNKKKQK